MSYENHLAKQMWVLDTFYLAGGTLLIVSLLHLVVFWVARFLYPPQPAKPVAQVQAPIVQQPMVVNPALQQMSMPVPQPPIVQSANPPPVPPSYMESTLQAQVPVLNNDPLPPPLQVGKRPEDE